MRRHIHLLAALLASLPSLVTPAASRDTKAAMQQIISIDPVVAAGKDAPTMRLTFPAAGTRLPVIILSHGNRLSRADYQPLVTALARSGHVVIQPDHPDSSEDGFARTTPQPDDTWRVRVEQLRWIAGHARQVADGIPALRGRTDPSRIALVGHSFGGHTVALAMGATVASQPPLPPIKGISAAIMLAPPGGYGGLAPEWKERAAYLRTDWSTMRGPALVINGGKDMTPLTNQGPAWHDATFTQAPAGRDICLMVVKDAGHYLGGIDSVLRPPAGDATPERRDAVLHTIVTFLRARLQHLPADEARWTERRKALACK